jgi:hypothetical protein
VLLMLQAGVIERPAKMRDRFAHVCRLTLLGVPLCRPDVGGSAITGIIAG